MSAIFGVVRPRGRATAQDLATLRGAMLDWGPDGGGTWLGDAAGLGQIVAHRTVDDRHEQGPVAVAGGAVVVTAIARLDNRDELLADLVADPAERGSTPDGRLVALAVERWGESAPARLLGDWSFAAWDVRERRLTLVRDQYGVTALCYHRARDGSLAFASSLKALLALSPEARALDEEQVANHLFQFRLDGTSTCFDGVRRLPPAHALVFDDSGVRLSEYWHLEDAEPVRLPSDGDYVERFLELYGNAVRARVRSSGPVVSTLSAGLDSGSVTALAARELERVVAITARPAHPEIAAGFPGLVDEWEGAAATAAWHPNVHHIAVHGDLSPVAALQRSLDIHGEPELAAMNLPWLLDLFATAREHGARVLLTGQFGNGGISWPGDTAYAYHRLLTGDLRGAVRAIAGRHRSTGEDWPHTLWRSLGVPLRERIRAEADHRRRGRPALANSFINPELARRLGLAGRRRSAGLDTMFVRVNAREHRMLYLLPGVHPGGAIWRQHGEAHGFDARDPTSDVRLLEFCFAIPDEQFRTDTEDRWLLRRASERLMPPEVRFSRTRGRQGADYALRLRAAAAEVDEVLAVMRASALVGAYVDLAAVEDAWRAVRHEPPGRVLARASAFGRVLQLGMFLLRPPPCTSGPASGSLPA